MGFVFEKFKLKEALDVEKELESKIVALKQEIKGKIKSKQVSSKEHVLTY